MFEQIEDIFNALKKTHNFGYATMTEIAAILGGPIEATIKIFGAGAFTGAGAYGVIKYAYDKTKSKKEQKEKSKEIAEKIKEFTPEQIEEYNKKSEEYVKRLKELAEQNQSTDEIDKEFNEYLKSIFN